MAMFTAREKKDLKQLLASLANPEDFLSLEGLHGFLFGLAIIPEPIMPSEWLPCVFGEGMLDLQEVFSASTTGWYIRTGRVTSCSHLISTP